MAHALADQQPTIFTDVPTSPDWKRQREAEIQARLAEADRKRMEREKQRMLEQQDRDQKLRDAERRRKLAEEQRIERLVEERLGCLYQELQGLKETAVQREQEYEEKSRRARIRSVVKAAATKGALMSADSEARRARLLEIENSELEMRLAQQETAVGDLRRELEDAYARAEEAEAKVLELELWTEDKIAEAEERFTEVYAQKKLAEEQLAQLLPTDHGEDNTPIRYKAASTPPPPLQQYSLASFLSGLLLGIGLGIVQSSISMWT